MGQARRPEEPRILTVTPLEPTPAAERTAAALNRFLPAAESVLAGHTVNARRALAGKRIANTLLIRNAGSLPSPPPMAFSEKYGRPGAALTEMPVERGIARVLGLHDEYVGPMGADRDTGYRDRARRTIDLFARFPFVYVHLKGPDEPGHDGNALLKREIVEAIDRSFFGPLLEGVDRARCRLAVTADHATPASLKGHSDDPVPLLLVGDGVGNDAVGPSATFGEEVAARGTLGTRPGAAVMGLLLGSVPPTPP